MKHTYFFHTKDSFKTKELVDDAAAIELAKSQPDCVKVIRSSGSLVVWPEPPMQE